MSLDSAFRLSFYLTLTLACVCLAHAVQPHLPQLSYLVLPVAALLVVAYAVEGRWVLPVWLANIVALAITLVVGISATSVLLDGYTGRVEGSLASMQLLPYLGMFLLVLMLAKLFRPKRPFDYWFLHAMAFMSVALSCTLDNDFLFGLLLLPYLLCGLWSLSLFYLYRGTAQTGVRGRVPWRALGTWQAGRRGLLLLPVALAAFLLTPRYSALPAEAGSSPLTQFHTGLGEAVVDLNRTGTIHLNTEVAFEVQATDEAGEPKLDLDPEQYWRGAALNYYDRGRWFNRGLHLFRSEESGRKEDPPALPNLGPGQYFLKYKLSNRASSRRLLLSDPVAVEPGDPQLPVVIAGRPWPRPLAQRLEMEVLWPAVSRGELLWVYTQTTLPPKEPGLSRPIPVTRLADTPLTQPPDVPGLREWTDELLRQLVARGRLSASDLRRNADGTLIEANHERIARVLARHLSQSGEYGYSLQCPRRDLRADPVFDFLSNVKEGHCERFAGGLALMLRAEGVPARIVVGFHGAESQGEGRYIVRHSQAHSWVEVLIRRSSPAGREWHWLTLDPTPADETGQAAGPWWLSWWRDAEQRGGSLWNTYVIEYSEQQRNQAASAAKRLLSFDEWPDQLADGLAAVVALGVCLGLLWFARRSRLSPTSPVVVVFYCRLLDMLARRCRLRPEPAQTPHEFAELAARHLRETEHTAAVADVPAAVARLYYRVRYAGEPLTDGEATEINGQLKRLEAALQAV